MGTRLGTCGACNPVLPPEAKSINTLVWWTGYLPFIINGNFNTAQMPSQGGIWTHPTTHSAIKYRTHRSVGNRQFNYKRVDSGYGPHDFEQSFTYTRELFCRWDLEFGDAEATWLEDTTYFEQWWFGVFTSSFTRTTQSWNRATNGLWTAGTVQPGGQRLWPYVSASGYGIQNIFNNPMFGGVYNNVLGAASVAATNASATRTQTGTNTDIFNNLERYDYGITDTATLTLEDGVSLASRAATASMVNSSVNLGVEYALTIPAVLSSNYSWTAPTESNWQFDYQDAALALYTSGISASNYITFYKNRYNPVNTNYMGLVGIRGFPIIGTTGRMLAYGGCNSEPTLTNFQLVAPPSSSWWNYPVHYYSVLCTDAAFHLKADLTCSKAPFDYIAITAITGSTGLLGAPNCNVVTPLPSGSYVFTSSFIRDTYDGNNCEFGLAWLNSAGISGIDLTGLHCC